MAYLSLPSANLLRYEEDQTVIATLERKGWQTIVDPNVPGSTWDGTKWIPPAPAAPIPRWVEFSTTVMSDPSANAMLGALLQNVPGLYGGLTVGLQQASVGDTRAFLHAWNVARNRRFISDDLASAIAAMAANCDLPSEFVSALTSR